ncbi:ABC transporter substrate-binding protein [Aquamicrobium terrae]|uniref:Spermidine/putrescine transport system substrate-binding protein n=1 Tax=Aquamicrobium terrae TaxID=1324945 RepID=A0ABV2N0E1_9HYPH
MLKLSLAIAVSLTALSSTASAESLTVVSWGGDFAKSQEVAFVAPFREATGVNVRMDDWSGNIGQIQAMVDANNVTWDVVVGERSFAIKGCEEGFLEKIDSSKLPPSPDGRAASEDFLPGTILDCGIGSEVFAYGISYNNAAFPEKKPQGVADFFNLNDFPGRRGMLKRPESTLEFALLADGVAKEDLYKVLATSDGLERAFAKLDSIKDQVVWFDSFAQPPQILNDGEAVMVTGTLSRIIQPMLEQQKDWNVIMNDFLWDVDVWMVVKNSPNKQQAFDFINFASEPQRIAVISTRAAYDVSRASASQFVDSKMKPYLFTNPDTITKGVQVDPQFWADNMDRIKERFNNWLVR